jgi:branched-chain amino acid transport system substrate-binding protein
MFLAARKGRRNMGFRAWIAALSFVLLSAVPVWAGPPEPIRVAAIFAETGPAVRSAVASRLGVRFAVDHMNASGGVLGRPVELVFFDNHSTPIGSKKAAEQAVAMGAVGIVGSSWSEHSVAAAHVAQSARLPMVSNVSTHPDVTLVGDYIFRACFIDPFQGRVMARFAYQDLGFRNVAVLRDITSLYSVGLAREFTRHFEALGGKVPAAEDYKLNQEGYERSLIPLKKWNPEAVFLPGHDESGIFAGWTRRMGWDIPLLGGDGWSDKAFYDLGGKNLKKGYHCTHWAPEVDTPVSRAFVAAHPGIELTADLALGYDATRLLLDAIQRAGSTEGPRIRDALADTHDFVGVSGPIRFDEHRNPFKDAVIIEIVNGQNHYLKTVSP